MALTVPNMLTLLRFALLPVFVWVFFAFHPLWALLVYGFACLTDVLDGVLARKLHQEGKFGQWADPLADKLNTMTVLTCLTIVDYLPWPFIAFFALKELLMIVGGVVLYFNKGQKKVYPAQKVGKTAMIVVFLGIVASFFQPWIAPWHIVLMCIGVGVALYAFVYYLKRNMLSTASVLDEVESNRI